MTAKQVQIRRDSATNLNAATPADGELGYDTTNDELRIGDGATAGGIHIPNSKMIQAQSYIEGTAGGSADAITLTLSPVPASYVTGSRYVVKLTATNATTTPTLNVNGLGAKTIKKKSSTGAAAMAAGDLQNGCIYSFHYDGTNMQVEAVDQGSAAGSSAGLTVISSGSFGAVSLLDITSIPATYRSLVLVVTGASASSASRALQVLINAGGGFGTDITQSLQTRNTTNNANMGNGNAWLGVQQTAAQISACVLNFPAYQSGPIKTYNGVVSVAEVAGSSYVTAANMIIVSGVVSNSGTAVTGAITGLRINWDNAGAVFDAGTYALYGVN